MKHVGKKSLLLILLVVVAGAAYYIGSQNSPVKTGDLYVWNPPQDVLLTPATNITNSATCRFQKSFNTFFTKKVTDTNPNPSQDIYYNFGDDNEADTVTFTDLDTPNPKVTTNSGESALTVLNDNPDSITLIDLNGIDGPDHGFSTYKLFKKNGVLIYSDASDDVLLLGPTGTLEMGYCN